MIGEAEQTLALIAPLLPEMPAGVRFLEIGGGVALVYAYLRFRGYRVDAIEPGSPGFGDRYTAGRALLEILGVSAEGWYRLSATQLPELGRKYPLIFSNFVLEDVPALEEAFEAMSSVLAEDARMIHRVPNYLVPYEPHFDVPLVPFAPRLTAWFFARLRGAPLWEDLRFVSVPGLRRLCRSVGLEPTFRRGLIGWAFRRLLEDPQFARLVNRLGLLGLLDRLPAALATPAEFTARRIPDRVAGR